MFDFRGKKTWVTKTNRDGRRNRKRHNETMSETLDEGRKNKVPVCNGLLIGY